MTLIFSLFLTLYFNGRTGFLKTTQMEDGKYIFSDLAESYARAGTQIGYNWNDDFNGEVQEGFGKYPHTIYDGRSSGIPL